MVLVKINESYLQGFLQMSGNWVFQKCTFLNLTVIILNLMLLSYFSDYYL